MKFLKRILHNQLGITLPMVLVIVSIALGSIGYITLNLLPKLQDGKKKAEQAIQYRIFIGSLNDYLVHGIRERWCLSSSGMTAGVIESDMLIANSTDCASTKSMEEVVTYRANLERLLWDSYTTGQPNDDNLNTILGLNKARFAANKTTVQLNLSDVALPDGKMKFRIPESVFNNMSNLHPLYIISQEVKGCFNFVDIEIEQLNESVGDEKKLKITIQPDIKQTKLSCLAHKYVKSTSFYTFYPRRLHTFALIKYDDLDAGKFNEFYGPVYLAGRLNLPATDVNKDKSSIFYDSLTLATYNGGTSGIYRAGEIIMGGAPYTYEERGDPYKSKQNEYETFRGIHGGLRLDAVEDKGLYNIFDYTSTNQSNVATLEACIDDSKVKTTPSYSDGTLLAYSAVTPDQAASPGKVRFKIGYTKKNRFKPTLNAPGVITGPPPSPATKFIVTVPSTMNTSAAISDISFRTDANNDYRASLSENSEVHVEIELAKFDLTQAALDQAILSIDAPTSSKATYQDIIPSGHILRDLQEYQNYKTKTEDLFDKCDEDPAKASVAHCQDPFPPDYATVSCVHTTDPQCDLSNKFNAYTSGKAGLRAKLVIIRDAIAAPGSAKMILGLESFNNSDNKKIINQKYFSASFTDKWKVIYPLLNLEPEVVFTGYHYGSANLQFKMKVVKNLNQLIRLEKQNNGNLKDFISFSDWHNSYDDSHINGSDDPEELIELDCPIGMGFADWALDMSASSNFAWNYANVPAGVNVDVTNHDSLALLEFKDDANFSGHYKGSESELTKSVVLDCVVKKEREYVYGFYVCKKLTIEGGRSKPLNLIGTWIVQDLVINETAQPVRWHSVWTPIARDLVLTELNGTPKTPICTPSLTGKTLKQIVTSPNLKEQIKKCSSQELVSNGPNNFTWTTIDPEIGIDPANPVMTAQKVNRHLRWVMREDSRKDLVK